MKAAAILITIGLAAAASARAEATDAHTRAAALLNSTSTLEVTMPALTLPSVTASAAVDSHTRAANLLQRPLPSQTTFTVPAAAPNRMIGAAPDAHDLARRLLDRRA